MIDLPKNHSFADKSKIIAEIVDLHKLAGIFRKTLKLGGHLRGRGAFRGAWMAQLGERSPPTNVACVRFPVTVSYVG